MLALDLTSGFGAKVAQHLENDRVAWLTTVDAAGQPQPTPVWFIWQDGSLLLYSQPNQAKLRNIAAQPRVSLNFNGDPYGGDIVVLLGAATIDPALPAADAVPAYAEKYADGMRNLGVSAAEFAKAYSVAFRIEPDRVRGH